MIRLQIQTINQYLRAYDAYPITLVISMQYLPAHPCAIIHFASPSRRQILCIVPPKEMTCSIDRHSYYDQRYLQYSGPERPRKNDCQYVAAKGKQDEGL